LFTCGEFGSDYILFGASQNEGNHFETTKDNISIAHSFPGSVIVAHRGVQSCVSLVGGMATLTTASVRCENCEFLSRPKLKVYLCVN